jgi:hypothetical protein
MKVILSDCPIPQSRLTFKFGGSDVREYIYNPIHHLAVTSEPALTNMINPASTNNKHYILYGRTSPAIKLLTTSYI